MKRGMRTLVLLLILGFVSGARKPRSERRSPAAPPGREKRSPFGYVVRGPNHVAAFQMGSLDDGLLGHFPKFTSNGIQRGGAFVANHLSDFFNDLVGPTLSRSPDGSGDYFRTKKPVSEPPVLFNKGPVLGEKGAPVFPQGNVIGPRIQTLPPPRLPVNDSPPINLAPSIRSPPATTRQSTQYFVLGDVVPAVTDLYNHPSLPTVNPLHPFTGNFHNYPTIVTLGHSNAGVLPTLNPSRAFPTLNPPFYTNSFETYAVSRIEPTRTFLQPTYAPLPPPPPLIPPLRATSYPSVHRQPVAGPVTNFPKGTFFWFKLNNENFTFSPNYRDFMKSYQNPLFFTRPMQNSFFRPFFSSGNRAFLYPSGNRVPTVPTYVPNYFPGQFPLNIPFLKAEDEHPAEGHPAKHTTIYHGPAGGPSPTNTVRVPEATDTSSTGTDSMLDPEVSTPDSTSDPTTSPDPDPDTSSDKDLGDGADTASGSEIDDKIESSTELPDSQSPDERSEPAYKGFSPATEAPREPPGPEVEDEEDQTKEPSATVIPFDTSTSPGKDLSSRPRSFDQSSNDRDQAEEEATTQDESLDDETGDNASVRRTGKSSRDSNDYDQLFVDFMTNPNSIDGAGRPESGPSSTAKPELDREPETTTAPAIATTLGASSKTTTVPFDEFDHFVDIFASEKPHQEETTVPSRLETTPATATTELEPEETTTTTRKPKFKLTTKSRPRLTSIKTTTARPNIRTTIKFKLRSTTIRPRIKITEPTTAKPTKMTTEAETSTETTRPLTELTTPITEPTTSSTEPTTTTEASTTMAATIENTEEPTTGSAAEDGTTYSPVPLATPEREEVPTTIADERLPSTAAIPTTLESTTMTTTADVTTVSPSETSRSPTEVPVATTPNPASEDPHPDTTVGSADETTAATPPKEPVSDEFPTTTIPTSAETPTSLDESAAMNETQTAIPTTLEPPASNPTRGDSSPGTTTPESHPEMTEDPDRGSGIAEESSVATPRDADSSLKDSGENDGDPPRGQEGSDGGNTEAYAPPESHDPGAAEQPHPNQRRAKKLEDDEETSTAPTSQATSRVDDENSSTTTTGSSTDQSATETAPGASSSVEPTSENTETAESTTARNDLSEASTEAPGTPTSKTETSTVTVVKQTELEERRERVPETVLVGGRNYSDVQDNHPVVTDVETSEDNKKVRRAATWFVWFLDKEKIAKNLVNDVSNFAASRNIIYVVTTVLLISSMLSLMGLYCTLRSKK